MVSKDNEEGRGGTVLGAAVCGVLLLLILYLAAPSLIALPLDRCGCWQGELRWLFAPVRWLMEHSKTYETYIAWQCGLLGVT